LFALQDNGSSGQREVESDGKGWKGNKGQLLATNYFFMLDGNLRPAANLPLIGYTRTGQQDTTGSRSGQRTLRAFRTFDQAAVKVKIRKISPIPKLTNHKQMLLSSST